MRKICYIDTETGGVEPERHALLTVAAIVEIGGDIMGSKKWRVKPWPGDDVEERALDVNGLTREEIAQFPEPEEFLQDFQQFLSEYVNKFDRLDKFVPAGYNVRFDLDFLRAFFGKGGDRYFGSWFSNYPIDPFPVICWLHATGKLILPDLKLGTICDHFAIPLGEAAHDAMADILATKTLIEILDREVFSKWGYDVN